MLWLVATILSDVCMDCGSLAWLDMFVHGVIGSNIPCKEEGVSKQV